MPRIAVGSRVTDLDAFIPCPFLKVWEVELQDADAGVHSYLIAAVSLPHVFRMLGTLCPENVGGDFYGHTSEGMSGATFAERLPAAWPLYSVIDSATGRPILYPFHNFPKE